jgi:hypothetical protein
VNSKSTQKVSYRRDDIVRVLRDLNLIVVSLDKLGSASVGEDEITVLRWTDRFLNEWGVGPRLSAAREVLSGAFSYSLDAEESSELERLMADVPYWRYEAQKPPRSDRSARGPGPKAAKRPRSSSPKKR